MKQEESKIRESIRRIISEILENEEPQETDDSNIDKFRRAVIALSKGDISSNDLVYIYGSLYGADMEETGHEVSNGEVEIRFIFEGVEFTIVADVQGSFYYNKGDSGVRGASVDVSIPPTPSESDNESITFRENTLHIGDDDGEYYEFPFSELGREVKRGLERFVAEYYDPIDERIGSRGTYVKWAKSKGYKMDH